VPKAGIYHISIFSKRCVSLTDYRDNNLDIFLDPPTTVTRNFVLKPACQLRLTVVDGDGRPVPEVGIYKPGGYDGDFPQTDEQGRATVGGMAPSPILSRFVLHQDDFAFAFVDVKLNDPTAVVERKVTLSEGKSVRGTVTCSDGKPASGCTILALPSWWAFGASPAGEPIKDDGSFELRHVGPGNYTIRVHMPKGGNSSISRTCLSNVDLFNRKDPLAIRLDLPSLASMGFIEGRIRFKGDRRPKRGFWINVRSPAPGPPPEGEFAQHDDKTFKVGPLPAGQYTLTVESAEIESKQLGPFVVGTRNVDLDLSLRAPMVLKGVITGDDGQPFKNLRVRLLQTRYLRGSNFEPNREWRPVPDPNGAFTADLPGPGVYVVEVSADGYAIGKSAPASSETDLNMVLRIKLSRGLTLTGRVVDEAGRPIIGATVLARSRFGWQLPVSAAKLPAGSGVATADGRFQFDHLSPGKETIRALHPDFVFGEVRDLELTEGGPQPPVTITMKRGGTVRGRVYDQTGRPAAGVPLHFRLGDYSAFEGNNEFAAGVSDEAGDYEVAHLPEALIYITQGNTWTSLGVVRQAVLPASGRTIRVDFGGIKKVTGRLIVNGAPVANTKVTLSDDNPQGELIANAMTDGDGNFVFRGIPPGERYLYYTLGTGLHMVRVKPLRIETSNDAFGTIEVVTGTLAIHCPDAPDPQGPEIASIWLSDKDPVSLIASSSIAAARRQSKEDPFLFRDVPVGKHALTLRRPRKLGLRQMIQVTGPGEHSMTIDVPQGTASLRGKVERFRSGQNRFLQLESKDQRLFADIGIQPDGSFEIDELPAGDYSLKQLSGTDPDPLAAFSVADGEKKSISMPALGSSRKIVVRVRPYTADGLPLPGCNVTLVGAQGDVPRRSVHPEESLFVTEPGPYRVSASYPGFAPTTKQIDVKAARHTPWGSEDELAVTLVRSTDPPKPAVH
jgi:protocatechuate 3,4-dioxygenase beta subunit